MVEGGPGGEAEVAPEVGLGCEGAKVDVGAAGSGESWSVEVAEGAG